MHSIYKTAFVAFSCAAILAMVQRPAWAETYAQQMAARDAAQAAYRAKLEAGYAADRRVHEIEDRDRYNRDLANKEQNRKNAERAEQIHQNNIAAQIKADQNAYNIRQQQIKVDQEAYNRKQQQIKADQEAYNRKQQQAADNLKAEQIADQQRLDRIKALRAAGH
jgi:hypothetical protein